MVRFGIVTPEKLLLIFYFCEKNAKMGIASRLSQNMLD